MWLPSPVMRRRPVLALIVAIEIVAIGIGAVSTPAPTGAAEAERYVDRIFEEVDVDRDVAYGAALDEHGRRQELNVDVYTPVGDTAAARPAIVLAHGGSFVAGNKDDMAELATAYAERGFVAMSIEYRMDEGAGGISFPPDAADIVRIYDAKYDMQAAVRWSRTQAATYGIDPQRVSVGGSSAGAVTAVLVATTPDDPGASGSSGISSAVCTAVSLMGAGEPALVDEDDAGAIFFHGDQDHTVPYSQAVLTKDAMDDAGLPAEMVTFEGAGHHLPDSALVEQRSSEWMVEQVVERDTGCGAPADPASVSFVKAAYQDLLGRAPSDDEVVQQAGLLDVGGTRAALLSDLTSSDEWLGAIVTGFYEDTLGRDPDAAGLEYWVGALRSGRYSVAEVAASFYASAEYRVGTNEEWVADLYEAILGRPASSDDVAYWVGQVEVNGPSWVAVRLYGSLESRRDRVTALYEHLLGRSPEPDGLAYWAGRLATAGDLALARNLAASAEYRTRAIARYP